jgi:hypothetical protein
MFKTAGSLVSTSGIKPVRVGSGGIVGVVGSNRVGRRIGKSNSFAAFESLATSGFSSMRRLSRFSFMVLEPMLRGAGRLIHRRRNIGLVAQSPLDQHREIA